MLLLVLILIGAKEGADGNWWERKPSGKSFTSGGFSSVIDGITTYRKSNNRYCSKEPITEGVYCFKGNLRIVASQRVKRTLRFDKINASYEVSGVVSGRYVSYDEEKDITTIEIYSNDPFVLSLAKKDNSAFKKDEFELIAYTPFEKIDLYDVHLKTINPCEKSNEIVRTAE